jgi:hypothetical protein
MVRRADEIDPTQIAYTLLCRPRDAGLTRFISLALVIMRRDGEDLAKKGLLNGRLGRRQRRVKPEWPDIEPKWSQGLCTAVLLLHKFLGASDGFSSLREPETR